jgi:hypothetical protein
MKNYTSKREISALVRDFENGTIAREEWNHNEHLIVAFYYIFHYDLETATDKMRRGILNLLKSFNVDFSKEMPYHETLTCFWMQAINIFARSTGNTSIVEVCNNLVERFDKDLPLKFYSRTLLFSDKARAEFVEPDLQNF